MKLCTTYRHYTESDNAILTENLPRLLGGSWNLESLNAAKKLHQLRVLYLRESSAVVAFAEFQIVLDECELLNIAVLPEWQRKGVGEELLRQVLAEANSLEMSQCFLEVRESNLSARNLYHKLGFKPVGERKDYYPAQTDRENQPKQQNQGKREAAIVYLLRLQA